MGAKYITTVFCFFLLGCGSIPKDVSDECKDFFAFFKENWVKNEETLIYGFKGEPNYWLGDKYFKEECFKGLSKKEMIKLLGKPSKSFVFNKYEQHTYCLFDKCLHSFKSTTYELVFVIEKGIITGANTNPAQQAVEE